MTNSYEPTTGECLMNMLRNFTEQRAPLVAGVLAVLLMAPPGFSQRVVLDGASARAGATEVVAEVVVSNPEPAPGDTIEAAINIDTRNLQGQDNRLAAYQAKLEWDETVLQFLQFFPGLPPWNNPNVNTTQAPDGRLDWNAFRAGGEPPGVYNLLRIRFKVIGAGNATTPLDLSFSELITAFARNLLTVLEIRPGKIIVRERNLPPVLQPIPNQTVEEGKTQIVTVQATDPDGNTITLTRLNFPPFVQLTDNGNGTGSISIQPAIGDSGSYPRLGVVATDNGSPALSDTALFDLIVNPAENPPVLQAIPDQTMKENDTLRVNVVATDPDGDDIVLEAPNLPRFGAFTDNHNGTGVIVFTPGFEDAGVYANLEVTARDNGNPPLSARQSFKLTVQNVNRPPDLQDITATVITVNEGEVLELALTATDPDGDSLRFSAQNLPIFCRLTDNRNGTASLRMAPGFNDAGNYPNITIAATDNGIPNLSDSDAFNLVIANVTAALTCGVEMVSPLEGARICGDTVQVCLKTRVAGGVPPITGVCEVNGIAVPDSCVKVPLVNGANILVAKCTFTDAQGTVCTSSDTIRVVAGIIQSSIAIAAPRDSSFICADSISVSGTTTHSGGVPPFTSVCTVNDSPADSSGDTFGGTVALAPGYNSIIVACTITDALGCTATSRDTVVVFSDPTPATATLNFDNLPVITGEIIDDESGIAKVELIEATNRTVTVDSFTVGDKRVAFSSDKIDPNKRSSFTFRVTNVAGCVSIVDPVYVKITAARGVYDLSFNLLETDRFLFVRNDGLQKIRFLINGQAVNLQAGGNGGSNGSTHFMPAYGLRSVDLSAFMLTGENYVDIICTGPAGSSAELLFSDVYVPDAVTGIEAEGTQNAHLPATFALGLNFPNPFNPETAISFEVPAGWASPITLRIFNVQGQLVRSLAEGVMPPGKHNIVWNGKDDYGRPVATGIYLYQIVSGDYRAVRKMLMAK